MILTLALLLAPADAPKQDKPDRDKVIQGRALVVAAIVARPARRMAAATGPSGRRPDGALRPGGGSRRRATCPRPRRCRRAMLGLGVAMDRSSLMRYNPVVGLTWRRVETNAERTARLAALGEPTMHGRHDLAQHFFVSAALTAVLGREGRRGGRRRQGTARRPGRRQRLQLRRPRRRLRRRPASPRASSTGPAARPGGRQALPRRRLRHRPQGARRGHGDEGFREALRRHRRRPVQEAPRRHPLAHRGAARVPRGEVAGGMISTRSSRRNSRPRRDLALAGGVKAPWGTAPNRRGAGGGRAKGDKNNTPNRRVASQQVLLSVHRKDYFQGPPDIAFLPICLRAVLVLVMALHAALPHHVGRRVAEGGPAFPLLKPEEGLPGLPT